MTDSTSRLETRRLLLRPQETRDAEVFRQLWAERDERVPAHRRIGPDGRPDVADISDRILQEKESVAPRLLSVQRRATADVIGYCGLVLDGSGAAGEPELAFELLRAVHNQGYATEAARAVLAWTAGAGYARVWAGVWEWNTASRRVLEKLGFVDSGHDRPRSVHGRNILMVKEVRPRGARIAEMT